MEKHLFNRQGAEIKFNLLDKTENRIFIWPCDAWALSAGAESWTDAVAEMKGGLVLTGVTPRMG